jgi:tetratricopeptide (TPR) repeat protein
LTDYNKAIELNPKYATAYYDLGRLKRDQLKDNQGAIADFRQAAKLYRQQGETSDLQDAIDRLKELGVGE